MNKAKRNKSFADYKQDAQNWITMANGDFYPDILPDACELYKPVLVMFGQFLKSSESSERLLEQITQPNSSLTCWTTYNIIIHPLYGLLLLRTLAGYGFLVFSSHQPDGKMLKRVF